MGLKLEVLEVVGFFSSIEIIAFCLTHVFRMPRLSLALIRSTWGFWEAYNPPSIDNVRLTFSSSWDIAVTAALRSTDACVRDPMDWKYVLMYRQESCTNALGIEGAWCTNWKLEPADVPDDAHSKPRATQFEHGRSPLH